MTREQIVEKINEVTIINPYGSTEFKVNGIHLFCADWQIYNAILYIYSYSRTCETDVPDALIPIEDIQIIEKVED